YILLEAPQAINDPVAQLMLEVRCGAISTARAFTLLLDPPEWFAARQSIASDVMPRTSAPEMEASVPQAGGRAPVESGLVHGRVPPSKPQQRAAVIPAKAAPAGLAPTKAQGEARPVLRLDPAAAEVNDSKVQCCFRLAYELEDRGGPAMSER